MYASTRFLPCSVVRLSKPLSPLGLSFGGSLRRKLCGIPFRLHAGNIDYEDPLEVEDINRDYCNDFVCTSSPLVEETIKAFGVDIQRPGKWTLSRFAEDVLYKVLSFYTKDGSQT